MGLAEDAASGPPSPRRVSRIDVWLDGLAPDDRAEAERVLDDPAWSNMQATALFTRYGLDVLESSVSKYRQRRRADGAR